MSIIDGKREIFANISALNALLPNKKKNDSLDSVNNNKNIMKFLADMLVVLGELQALKTIVVDVITFQIPRLEQEIKEGLKTTLKESCGCDINPSIPDDFKSTGSGIKIDVKGLDFFDIMKVDPNTIDGGLLYTDVNAGVNSKDFNTYLNFTIQDENTEQVFQSILNSKFEQTTTNGNNVLTFKADSTYDSGKSMVDFNNDYIDNISLFGSPGSLDSKSMVNAILEEIFSTVSSSRVINKTKEQIKKEVELKETLQKLIDSDSEVVQESVYTFSNDELAKIDKLTTNKKKGILEVECCGNINLDIPKGDIVEINNEFDLLNIDDKEGELVVVEKSLNNLANIQAGQVPSEDSESVKYNFFKEIIDKLILMFMTQLISPKFVTILMINFTIANGGNVPKYNNAIDLIKSNEKVFKAIRKKLIESIIAIVLIYVLRLYWKKVLKEKIDDKIERVTNRVKVMASLIPRNKYTDLLSKIIKIL
jgi:hypothetical protein